MQSPFARPFVCTGSPLNCRSFIVGLNAATRLPKPFKDYWSDQKGFDGKGFDRDYDETRSRKGNRPVIEAISSQLGDCLETKSIRDTDQKSARSTAKDRESPIIEYLFRAIRPEVVFVYSGEPIAFFEKATGCHGFTEEPKRAEWHGHEFLLFGRRGPLYTLGRDKAIDLGKLLASQLN